MLTSQFLGRSGIEYGPVQVLLRQPRHTPAADPSGRVGDGQLLHHQAEAHGSVSSLVPQLLQNRAAGCRGASHFGQFPTGGGAASAGSAGVTTAAGIPSSLSIISKRASVAALLAGTSACGLRTHWKQPSSVSQGQLRIRSAARSTRSLIRSNASTANPTPYGAISYR